MNLKIKNTTKFAIKNDFFKKIIKSAEKVLKNTDKEISVVLVGLKKIRDINKKYRKKDKSTNTISFSYKETSSFPGENLFGEIFLCPSYIKNEAKEYGISFNKQMKKVFIHALLHVYGYTHNNDKDENEMNEMGEEIRLSEL